MNKPIIAVVCLGLTAVHGFTESYTNSLPTGVSYIANQLDHGSNTLATVFDNPPDGILLEIHSRTSCDATNTYFYDTGLGGWVDHNFNPIDPESVTFAPGDGGILNNTGPATQIVFSGTPHVPVLPVALPCGYDHTYLLSRQTNDIGSYENITGYPPLEGARLERWNGVSMTVHTFTDGAWSPAEPAVDVGESVFVFIPLASGVPTITQPPEGGTALAGNAAVFTVAATGPGPLAFSWMFNDVFMTDATNAYFQTPPLTPTNNGSYRVVVNNSSGSVTSSPAILTVLPAAGDISLEGFAFASETPGNLFSIPGLSPPVTWWSPSGVATKLAFPAETSLLGTFPPSLPCFDIIPSPCQAAGMTFAQLNLAEAGSSLQITARGSDGVTTDVPWVQVGLSNAGSSLEVLGAFPSGNASNLIAVFSLGGTVIASFTNPGQLQLSNAAADVLIVGASASVGLDSPALTVNFASPVGITGYSNLFDAVTFKYDAILPASSITRFRLCGHGVKPLQIICADTKVGPLKIDLANTALPVLQHYGNGNLLQALSIMGPWIELTNASSPLPLDLSQAQQFFRKVDRSRRCCRFPMLFINSAPLPNATTLRVSSAAASTAVYFASASAPYIVDGHYPGYVDFKLPNDAPFPSGNLPGSFDLWVKGNTLTDKHVLIQWLDAGDAVLCEQEIATPCPIGQDAFEPADQTNLLSACSCVGATITTVTEEEDTTESADVEAELGEPVQIAPNQWLIPNLSEIDPPTASITTNFTLSVEDDEGNEQDITLPTTIDAFGNILLTVPDGAGSYTLTMNLASSACGTNEPDEDLDYASFKSEATTASFTYTQEDCLPAHFTFTDNTTADPGWTITTGSEQWTIYDFSNVEIATGSGGSFGYTFTTVPSGSQCYKVEMIVTETGPDPQNPSGPLLSRMLTNNQCVTYTEQLSPDFTFSYGGCVPGNNYVVEFFDASTPDCSGITYDWNFGDGSPVSHVKNPEHSYPPGAYVVTLTIHKGADSATTDHNLVVQEFDWNAIAWSASACPDGAMVFRSSADSYWEFSGGHRLNCIRWLSSCDCECSDKKTVRVCYPSGTTNLVTLWATNSLGAYCSTNFYVQPLDLGCCRRGKFKETYYHSYGGSSYQIKVKERFHGGSFHTVVSKTKVKKQNSKGNYRRKGSKVYYVRAAYDGTLYARSFVSDCECDLAFHASGAVHHYHRRRAAKHGKEYYDFPNLRHWNARPNSVEFIHEVRVDANDPGWSLHHTLSDGSCKSGGCR